MLEEALELVNGDRAAEYGPPALMAQRVSDIAFTVFGIELSPVECIQFMMAMKLARLRESPDHEDSWIDLAGYIELLDKVTSRRKPSI